MEKILCHDYDLRGNVIRTYEWKTISIQEAIEMGKTKQEEHDKYAGFDPYKELMSMIDPGEDNLGIDITETV